MTSLALTQSGRAPGQLHAEYRRHCRRIGFTRHRERDIESAGADRQHAERARSRRMTVGAQQRFTRTPETFHMNDMANPIAGSRIPYPVSAARTFEEEVILCVQIVDLQKVVIDILNAHFCLHSIQLHRFKR